MDPAPAQLVDTHGRPLTERRLRQGLRVNILAGSFGMMWAAVAGGMPLTMFLEAIGASNVTIGLSATVQQFAMLLQVPTAFISEMLPARKAYWATAALLHRACWLLPALLPFVLAGHPGGMAAALVAVMAVSSILAQVSTAAWWSWMSDLVPERLRGSFWGTRQSITMMAYLVAMAVAGLVLDHFAGREGTARLLGFSLVFGAAGLLGCADILVHLGVPEPRPQPVRFDRNVWRRVAAPLREPDFRMLTLALSVWSFALWIVAPFGFVCLKQEYGVNYTYMSLTTISSSLGVIAAGFLWAYVMDRLGARNFGVIMILLAPACGLAWFFLRRDGVVAVPLPWGGGFALPQPVAVLLVANFVAGAFYSGVGLAQISLLGALSSPRGRTMAMAVHWAVLGVTTALGPVAGGWISDWFATHPVSWTLPTGTRFHFYHALVLLQLAICWLVAVPLLLRVRRRAGEMAFRTAVSRFVILNPVRMASSIYNIYIMGAAESAEQRASAVRKLGEEKTAIAVADLIGNLDDPAPRVREEAVLALGSIGSPDAVAALLSRLASRGGADLVCEIARALRGNRDWQTMEALLQRLPEADRQTRCEIVRTVGESGDRRAGAAVLRLLHDTDDPKLVAVCAEALGRLGDTPAAYEILPRLKATSDPLTGRTLAAALGDLLGEPGAFYRLLSREQHARGSAAEGLLRDIARAVEHVARARPRRDAAAGEATAAVHDLDAALAEARNAEAARLLLTLGLRVARLEYGVELGGDLSALVENLICRNERFGIGLWYLVLLDSWQRDGGSSTPSDTDLLLGLHFLHGWARRYL